MRRDSTKVVSKTRQALEIIVLTDYDLSKLKQEFKLADFERQPKWGHVLEIAEAIKQGRLYDPILTVMERESESDQYEIIDGQHRFLALVYLFEQGLYKTYTFAVVIQHGEDAREVYRRLNSGKPLTVDDILKSYDDGKVEFFTRMKPYCVFYSSHPNKVSFATVLRAYHYSMKMRGFASRGNLASIALAINSDNIEKLNIMMMTLEATVGIDNRGRLFKQLVLSGLMKIFFNNFEVPRLDKFTNQFGQLAQKVLEDQRIGEILATGKGWKYVKEIEVRMLELWQQV